MKKGVRQHRKCCCPPDEIAVENWQIIRKSGRDAVVRCARCGMMWVTKADYAAELSQETISDYRWRKLVAHSQFRLRDLEALLTEIRAAKNQEETFSED